MMTDEQMATARKQIRESMREKFDKWMTVYDEDATDDDINAAKAAFDAEVAKYRNKTYVLFEGEDAIKYVQLIQKWNRELNHWEKGAWRGILTFDKVLSQKVSELTDKTTDKFEVDYNTLMFMYQSMTEPAGTGYDEALKMAEFENFDVEAGDIADNGNFVTYSHVLEVVFNHIREITNADKMLKLMRERINIATAGVKIDWKISEVEEFLELHDAWLGEAVNDQMPQ